MLVYTLRKEKSFPRISQWPLTSFKNTLCGSGEATLGACEYGLDRRVERCRGVAWRCTHENVRTYTHKMCENVRTKLDEKAEETGYTDLSVPRWDEPDRERLRCWACGSVLRPAMDASISEPRSSSMKTPVALYFVLRWMLRSVNPGLPVWRLRLRLHLAFSRVRAIKNNDIVNNVP